MTSFNDIFGFSKELRKKPFRVLVDVINKVIYFYLPKKRLYNKNGDIVVKYRNFVLLALTLGTYGTAYVISRIKFIDHSANQGYMLA